jgi:hypothetical protein
MINANMIDKGYEMIGGGRGAGQETQTIFGTTEEGRAQPLCDSERRNK